MTGSSASSTAARAFLARRRARLERLLQRPLEEPAPSNIPPDRRRFLFEEAQELYWNELEWEKLTEDEMASGRELVELAFPGFLALIDGLLLQEVMPDSKAPACPRPEVVEDVLLFLAGRCADLADADDDDEDQTFERDVTTRLIDLVLYRLHDLQVEGGDWLELTRSEGDD
jgi:hypothetical protein